MLNAQGSPGLLTSWPLLREDEYYVLPELWELVAGSLPSTKSLGNLELCLKYSCTFCILFFICQHVLGKRLNFLNMQEKWILQDIVTFKNMLLTLGMVAHACNLSTLGDRVETVSQKTNKQKTTNLLAFN